MNETTHPEPEPLINPDEVTEVIVLPLTPIEPPLSLKKCETCQETAWMTSENTKCEACSKRKPFAKFTQVVNGLTSIDGMDTAMYYAKFHYDAEQSVEENIDFISNIIEQDL